MEQVTKQMQQVEEKSYMEAYESEEGKVVLIRSLISMFNALKFFMGKWKQFCTKKVKE